MVHPGGRPRTVSFSEEEMIALGEEMVNWVKLNKPIHLSVWYTQEKDFTDEQWDTFRKCKEFFHYYTKALKLVGYSYLDKDSAIDVRLKDRWQRVYFKDLVKSENEDVDRKIEKELEAKQKLIDYEHSRKTEDTKAPRDDILTLEDENMMLKAKLKAIEDKINAGD